jgi:N utilization substance protein B
MGRRRQAREIALQALYRCDLNPGPAAAALTDAEGFASADGETRAFARELVEGVMARREEIDAALSRVALHWTLPRMAAVDRNVLRLAVYEMLACGGTPSRVVLDEAIELAKAFGGEDSGNFVNGILDRICAEMGRA